MDQIIIQGESQQEGTEFNETQKKAVLLKACLALPGAGQNFALYSINIGNSCAPYLRYTGQRRISIIEPSTDTHSSFATMPSIFTACYFNLALVIFVARSYAQVPTAGVSIVSDSDYETARPCIQTCLWYNGGLGRGGNSGFDDVGKALGCGQSPINACYCSDRLTASATSYFSSCISDLCTAITDPADLSSALSIYGRYCSTANQVSAVVTSGSSNPSAGSGTTSSATSGPSPPQTPASTSTGPPTSATAENKSQSTEPTSSSGLTTTSKIALGVGLGIGIPLLIMFAAILVVLLRRGRGKGDTNGGLGGIETSHRY
ncbi:hypothetical protein TWF506_004794 [Arthrobotrys conoides]|uniref:Extracellular membrane protein CFEM domain-containing protein n=1 Tax=Arthrobotrys conoides TaxID=74498 RepID=A0AAN8NB99_9PEZI